ncbi:DoxX family protein [bacterium]|nr:DoxX family protein [bacterium]
MEHPPAASAINSFHTVSVSHTALWTGRAISTLAILFLLFDSVSHIMELPRVEEWCVNTLGFPEHTSFGVGLTLLICILLYIIPRTSVLGAILLTGYLGGAVAINVRINSPRFSHVLFPVYLGIMLWGGLFLCEARLRSFIPFKKN